MELIELIKQFVRKQYLVVSHYPRGHLTLAGALCGLVLVLLLLPLGGDEDEANGRTEIVLDIDLSPEQEQSVATEQEQSDVLALADFVITPQAQPQIEVQPVMEDVTLWRNIEVKSGDNLSAIFSKVGLSDQDLFRVLNSSDEAKVLNQVYPGYQLDFLIPVNVDGEGELEQLRLLKSPLEGFLFTLNNNNYDVESS